MFLTKHHCAAFCGPFFTKPRGTPFSDKGDSEVVAVSLKQARPTHLRQDHVLPQPGCGCNVDTGVLIDQSLQYF